MPLGEIEAIWPVSSDISQARRTSLHHSRFLAFGLAHNFSVAFRPCTQAMKTPSFCGFGTTRASVTTKDAGVSALACRLAAREQRYVPSSRADIRERRSEAQQSAAEINPAFDSSSSS